MPLNAFVIGHPIAHSRSPLIHGHWLKTYGIDGSYKSLDIAPEALGDFVARVKEGEFVGGNVTIPHKETIVPLCDRIDDASVLQIGAINTLVMSPSGLQGFNTDKHGFLANLDDKSPGWDDSGGTAIVIGAGGAARAVVAGLQVRGFMVVILNRTMQKARELSEFFDGIPSVARLDAFASLAPKATLVVNTTSIGMHGTAFDGLPLEHLPKTALVTDIVYTPLETPLLAEARSLGLRSVDGLGMLLHQAVPGFEAWFGVRPEVTPELRQLVERDLGLI